MFIRGERSAPGQFGQIIAFRHQIAKALRPFRHYAAGFLDLGRRIPEHVKLEIAWCAMMGLLEIRAALFHRLFGNGQSIFWIFPIRAFRRESSPNIGQDLKAGNLAHFPDGLVVVARFNLRKRRPPV